MRHDPFYQLIIEGLNEPLDPDTFEHCAAELLRAEWPTIVPIRGGDDAGMDAAIADGKGEAFPLICTTAKDVIGNLTRSLTSYLKDGGKRRLAISITSQALTQTRRSNLEKRAKEKGFKLVQVYDQAAVADRLYRNPEWCRELLGLTGEPSALSVIPVTQRPLLSLTLVGREADYDWLCQTTGDRLLQGVPGVGKTVLLQKYAKEQEGLFVVSDSRAGIAAALRVQQPKRLIVDDAHLKLELIQTLLQMRRELGLDFEIVACAWPGGAESVVQALQLIPDAIRHLELLVRDQIVQVVKEVGIAGPNALVKELVDQAEGKPGLAVTLAHLCLRGGVQEVALGDALSRSVRTTFEPLVGRTAFELLGALALAGNLGTSLGSVAPPLGVPLADARRQIADLAAGGVVTEAPAFYADSVPRLSVRPPALRHALVRDLFFTGPARLQIEPFIGGEANIDAVIDTVLGAYARGATAAKPMLVAALEARQSGTLWAEYAALGREETRYVLNRHPELITTIAEAALFYAPEESLPPLIKIAVGDDRGPAQHPQHPIRRISDWITHTPYVPGESVRRRQILVRACSLALNQGTDARTVAQALKHALSPQVEAGSRDPGAGRTFTFGRGLVALEDLQRFDEIWSEVLTLLRNHTSLPLAPFAEALENLVYLRRWTPQEVPDTYKQVSRRLGRVILTDLHSLPQTDAALRLRLAPLATELRTGLSAKLDEEFQTLFPDRREAWSHPQKQAKAVKALAVTWRQKEPRAAVERLQKMDADAKAVGLQSARYLPLFASELAARVASPLAWAQEGITVGLADDTLFPFLLKAVERQEAGWASLFEDILDKPARQGMGVAVSLSLPQIPEALLSAALGLLPRFCYLVEFNTATGQICEQYLPGLLSHEDDAIASAAAIGLWQRKQDVAGIPPDLLELWRRAIIRASDDQWELRGIFERAPDLARDWVNAHKNQDHELLGFRDSAWDVAINVLTPEERIHLLTTGSSDFLDDDMIRLIVGNDVSIYEALLKVPELSSEHLSPLKQSSGAERRAMIATALEYGYSEEQIASAIYHVPHSWVGDESFMWQGVIDSVADLVSDADSRVHSIGALIAQWAERARDGALRSERNEEVFGIGH